MEAAGTMTDTKDDPRTRAPARRVEIFTGAGRRRIWSEAEKARIVAESSVQGASVSAVARAHGLTPAQVFRWRREGVGSKRSLPTASFAPVVISDGAAPIGTPPAGAPSVGASTTTAAEMIEIELKGARLRIPGRTRPATVLALIKALRTAR